MAKMGLSFPYIGKYNATDDGVVSYTDGQVLAKAVEMSTSIEASADNNLYADNGVAESDSAFGGGELSVTTDDLTQDASALIMGIVAKTITVGSATVKELVYDDDMNAPYLGLGVIIKKKQGTLKWRAVVFTKIKFSIFDESATTQGETIEWQTSEISATIMRDDSAKHAWKREATFETEAEARAYIKSILSVGTVEEPEEP
ncbi:major tail protein [Anaerotignum sp.]|uniref:major tail protein n=1 Tax=Anaerotignum sp. TaxID=2039241 RepID=UPI002896F435|nr:major tail protein [Anaerotignum sp.]